MTRERVAKHPGAAWVAAVAGAWLVAVACRTMQGGVAASTASAASAVEPEAVVAAPALRVGILPDAERVWIGAGSDVVVRGKAPGEAALLVRRLRRATFQPAAPGRLRLLESGEELELATVRPSEEGDLLQADGAPFRGLLEVRPTPDGRLTVVNVVNLEDYLRGVVPNELAPRAFPQIEALKAQAVAARTYALAHLGDYSAKGYDVCATAACQVYRGRSSEHPLTDRAVEETRGIVATWRGRPINAYYTSTCGGHTEGGGAIFDDGAPYLQGVACPTEGSSRHTVRTTSALPEALAGSPGAARDVALLEALGVVDAGEADPARLGAAPSEAELREWAARLQSALRRPADAEQPLPVGDGTLTRAEALARLAGIAVAAGAAGLAEGEVAGLAEGQLSVLHGEVADRHPIDPSVRLVRDVDGVHRAASQLALSVGDRVVYVEREGRIVYLEAEETHPRTGAGPASHYNWQVRLTPADVARTLARYGAVGRVKDLVPTRLGVSGRVVELDVLGSEGELELRGLRVRLGLGLRENLFVIDRERGPRGEVSRFVITGKGWGHGVGLCQVGAFGMAQAGATFDAILKHYYTGVRLDAPRSGDGPVGHP